MFVPRLVQPMLQALARQFPVLAITGPRQSGKTTLARRMFDQRPYVSLEDLDEREFARGDPRGFLARFPDGAVLDEVQRAPDILSYLQRDVDESGELGRWVLTGSQQFGVLAGVTQTLAGRIALVPLLPFSLSELQEAGRAPTTIEALLFRGLYPPVHTRDVDAAVWYGNYVATYIERDVRQLLNVTDLDAFQRFVMMCAARSGQLLNLSALANDCGITHNTAKAWISVLEASYIVYLLRPHERNFNKRLIKSPKLYFLDPGLASWLLGIERAETIATHAQRGPLFETWVVSEALKARYGRAQRAGISFWRDRAGLEIDLVADHGSRLSATEVKSGKTVASDALRPMRTWLELAGADVSSAWLVYGGDQSFRRSDVNVVGWADIASWTAHLLATS